MILKFNGPLQMQINDIARVAEFMWQKGWAERNAGNISVNITDHIGDENRNLPAIVRIPLYHTVPELEGQFYYVTSAGSRMRDVARNPLDQGLVTRVAAGGKSIDIIAERDLPPPLNCLRIYLCIKFLRKKPFLMVYLFRQAEELYFIHIPRS